MMAAARSRVASLALVLLVSACGGAMFSDEVPTDELRAELLVVFTAGAPPYADARFVTPDLATDDLEPDARVRLHWGDESFTLPLGYDIASGASFRDELDPAPGTGDELVFDLERPDFADARESSVRVPPEFTGLVLPSGTLGESFALTWEASSLPGLETALRIEVGVCSHGRQGSTRIVVREGDPGELSVAFPTDALPSGLSSGDSCPVVLTLERRLIGELDPAFAEGHVQAIRRVETSSSYDR